jgi:hypothetical protein
MLPPWKGIGSAMEKVLGLHTKRKDVLVNAVLYKKTYNR